MAKRIEIIGIALVITDTVTAVTLMDVPKSCVYYDVKKLEEEGIIYVTAPNSNGYKRVYKGFVEVFLSEAVNNLQQPFSITSIKTFFRENVA
jgi:hypothetical protein